MRIKKRSHNIQKKGFTLLELVVVIGIFLVVASVTVLNQRGFDNSILLDNLAYEIALSVREAQVYGAGARGFDTDFTTSYGVHFHTNDASSFALFGDTNSEGIYDADSVIERYHLNARFGEISAVCGIGEDGPECEETTGVDVSFIRPNPEPVFLFYDSSGALDEDLSYSGAYIRLTSPGGREKAVQIGVTGQIVVE